MANDETSDIEVTVTDGADPLENAEVTFTDHDDSDVTFTKKTNASGKATFTLPNEKYSVTATLDGYDDYESSSDVTVSADGTLTIEMEETTYDITITVGDGTDPISGATVTIGSDDETTDANGEVSFTLTADTYSAVATMTGYNDETVSITVDAEHTTFTITMTAESQGG